MFDETNKNNTEVRKDVAPAGFMTNTVVKGDVLQTLMEVPDEEVHLTFTSPPYYNARDYSIYRSYGEYLEFLKKVFLYLTNLFLSMPLVIEIQFLQLHYFQLHQEFKILVLILKDGIVYMLIKFMFLVEL